MSQGSNVQSEPIHVVLLSYLVSYLLFTRFFSLYVFISIAFPGHLKFVFASFPGPTRTTLKMFHPFCPPFFLLFMFFPFYVFIVSLL